MMIETDGPGGAEVVVIELARELRRRGHTVIAVGPDEGVGWLSGKLVDLGFERHTYHLDRAVDPIALRRMIQMLGGLRLDVIHSHEFDMAFYGALAARWLGVRHVITMHGSDQVMQVARRRIALQFASRISSATVAVSDHSRRYMEKRLPLLAGRIEVIPNGVPDRPGKREETRRALELDDDEVLVLSVGNLRPRKGHAVLVRAMGELAQDPTLPPWRLAIAGQGQQRDRLHQLAVELGISDRVLLLGQREDIPDLQAAADIYAMPSNWEGLPMAILEAMFGACPIVASDVGGIPEAVTPGREGCLVRPQDPIGLAAALRPLIEDRGLRERMGQAARARALRDFHVSTMTDHYERCYRGEQAPLQRAD
jgi:glycosyltransferase involved in cell wall biosynthesis